MDDKSPFLTEWCIRFLENKDIIRKEIIGVDKDKDGFDFVIRYKDKTKCFSVLPTLKDDILSKANNEGNFGFFTLNNIENIKFVLSNWKKLSEFKFLNIYFINPFSKSDRVWTLCPYIHERVCDKSSLELGLKSMAEMVEPVNPVELEDKIRLREQKSAQ
jgi:hypothetical protein